MAKLEAVAGEITAQAHRLRYLLERNWSVDIEALNLATMLCHDLESVNLSKLIEKYRRRGTLIQKEQDRRHRRRMEKSMRWVKEAYTFGLEFDNTHYASAIVDNLFHNGCITREAADQLQQNIDDSDDAEKRAIKIKRETKREAKKRALAENKPLKELPVTDGEFGLMMQEHVENTQNAEAKSKRKYTRRI